MRVEELEVVRRPPVGGSPPRGRQRTVLGCLIDPFRRGKTPPPQPVMGFYTDTTVCIGCKACEVACKQWNQLPSDGFTFTGDSYDNTGALSAGSWRHVKFVEQFADALPPREGQAQLNILPAEPPAANRWLMMSDVCKHCASAPCQQACPTGAIIYNEFGNVYIQPDICNGCAYCVAACPFGVVTRSDFSGHARKCTLCYDRQKDGLVPACAKACPTASIQFGPLDELKDRARKRVEQLKGRGTAEAHLYGDAATETYTELHSFYLLVDRPEVYGLPADPFNPWIQMTGDYLRTAAVGLATLAALLAAILLGGIDMQALNVPNPAGYAGRVVTKPPEWHSHVVLDLLFNNLATGLFLAAAACELAAPAAFSRVTTWAFPLALVLLLVDLLLLVLDLGDPLRFHHMLRVFKPTSPMSLGTWCLTAYSLFPTAIVAVEVVTAVGWVPADSGAAWWVRKLAAAGGLPFAFGSAAYKGVLFSVTAQPGWKDARWLGAYLINSAVLLGAAQMLVIAELTGEPRAATLLRPAVGLLAVLNLLSLAALARNLGPTLASVYPRSRQVGSGVAVVAGVAISVAVLICGGVAASLVVLAVLVATCVGVRAVIVDLPHRVGRLAR